MIFLTVFYKIMKKFKRKHYFWFRRDLRLEDNCGLWEALNYAKQEESEICLIFIFDTAILDKLKDKKDLRVQFIYQNLARINQELMGHQASIRIEHGETQLIWQQIIGDERTNAIFCNEDYEDEAVKRDQKIKELIEESGGSFHTYKDQVLFANREVCKANGENYLVFTPYKKTWLKKMESEGIPNYPSESLVELIGRAQETFPSLASIGFEASDFQYPSKVINTQALKDYDQTRDFPALQNGSSHLGIHLRFGTISPRQVIDSACHCNETWLSELIWREFFMSLLSLKPKLPEEEFKSKYSAIPWKHDENLFQLWCQGKTGYPIVDAGMRQLNTTGFMHNRVRMITASFLVKHLLIDWRWGERYFKEKLLDYDQSANVGNWQWVAGCGADAAPYFRIFNPSAQTKKFDQDYEYIRRWVPEFGTNKYPEPIIDHSFARQRCISTFKTSLQQNMDSSS